MVERVWSSSAVISNRSSMDMMAACSASLLMLSMKGVHLPVCVSASSVCTEVSGTSSVSDRPSCLDWTSIWADWASGSAWECVRVSVWAEAVWLEAGGACEIGGAGRRASFWLGTFETSGDTADCGGLQAVGRGTGQSSWAGSTSRVSGQRSLNSAHPLRFGSLALGGGLGLSGLLKE